MILLAPGFLLFLFISAPGGWRSLVAPRVDASRRRHRRPPASLQYAWNVTTLLLDPVPPRTALEALRLFWFDVTKADWRDTMVGQVPGVMATERLRMYGFDLHQQFGWPGLGLAALGIVALAKDRAPRGAAAGDVRRHAALRVDLQRRRHARLPAALTPDRGHRDCRRRSRPPPPGPAWLTATGAPSSMR